ncbi:MAG: hypothetical protein SFZ23_14860 [Planctomycetota bacterium]|nr:hypothetical protein [Planctomycetota bacterium]
MNRPLSLAFLATPPAEALPSGAVGVLQSPGTGLLVACIADNLLEPKSLERVCQLLEAGPSVTPGASKPGGSISLAALAGWVVGDETGLATWGPAGRSAFRDACRRLSASCARGGRELWLRPAAGTALSDVPSITAFLRDPQPHLRLIIDPGALLTPSMHERAAEHAERVREAVLLAVTGDLDPQRSPVAAVWLRTPTPTSATTTSATITDNWSTPSGGAPAESPLGVLPPAIAQSERAAWIAAGARLIE